MNKELLIKTLGKKELKIFISLDIKCQDEELYFTVKRISGVHSFNYFIKIKDPIKFFDYLKTKTKPRWVYMLSLFHKGIIEIFETSRKNNFKDDRFEKILEVV